MKRLLSVFLLLATVLPLQAQQVIGDLDLSSPQATFTTYLTAMVEYGKTERPELREVYISQATRCFDLRSIAATIREEVARKAAKNLKIFLDKYEIVHLEDIPESYPASKYVWRRPLRDTEISLIKADDSTWLFTEETIESLPLLLDSVSDQEVLAGVESTIQTFSFADWIRERIPKELMGRNVLLENWQWVALLIMVIIGALLDRTVVWILAAWIAKMMKRRKHDTNYEVKGNLVRPVGIFAMAYFWSIVITILDIPVQVLNVLYFATQVMMAVSGVWAAYNTVDIIANYFENLAERTASKFDDLLVRMLRRMLKILVIAFGVLFVADNFDIDITSLLAGVGIGGIALALAAKDTVENLFGSVTVLVDHPFEIGDWIKVGDLEGTVEDVGFRSTRIRTFYNSLISMPNSMLVNKPLDNMGRREYRRVSTKLGVQYDTPPERLEAFCEGIRELIRLHPYTRKDFYMVYFNEFADSSLNILLYAFFKVPDWATELRERHRLFQDIMRLANRLGVSFAFPTQTLHIENFPGATLTESQARALPRNTNASRDGKPEFVIQSIDKKDLEKALETGRIEAREIAQGLWGEGVQDPVSFQDPESMKTMRYGGDAEGG